VLVVLVLWLIAGRPPGAERHVLSLLGSIRGRSPRAAAAR
jgi:hypothetical protein